MVLGATLAVSLAYHLAGYPAGPTSLPVLVAVYSAAAAGRLLPALLASGAFFGVGFAHRSRIEGDTLGSRRSPRPRWSRPLPCWAMPATAGAPSDPLWSQLVNPSDPAAPDSTAKGGASGGARRRMAPAVVLGRRAPAHPDPGRGVSALTVLEFLGGHVFPQHRRADLD
jgi:hypothetical protein